MDLKQIFNSTHPLTNIEIQKYDQNEPRFNGVYSRGICNKSRWKCWCYDSLIVLHNNITYFESFEFEHIPEDIKTNLFRMRANNSIMCGYFCIGFIDLMLAGKTLIDYARVFSP